MSTQRHPATGMQAQSLVGVQPRIVGFDGGAPTGTTGARRRIAQRVRRLRRVHVRAEVGTAGGLAAMVRCGPDRFRADVCAGHCAEASMKVRGVAEAADPP